jgi:hypothetical protein
VSGRRGARAKLLRRLEGYWRLEAFNAALVPAAAGYLVLEAGGRLSWPLGLAMAASAFLLAVGAAAWRMELDDLKGRPEFGRRALPWLARAQPASLALLAAAAAGAAFEVARDGWSPSAVATAALAGLAALEYLNYFVVQLQHFDNATDLARLTRGRGFRTPHLARALRRWRARRAEAPAPPRRQAR